MAEDINKNQNTDAGPALNPETEALKKERDEYLNGWRRAKADLINYQQGESKRLEEVAKFGTEELLKEVISVIDNFDRAIKALGGDNKASEGLQLIRNQLSDIIRKRGVTRIEIKKGESYNPMYHEAIGMVEPSEELKSGTIAEEVEPGYMHHEYVLRPARVKVVS